MTSPMSSTLAAQVHVWSAPLNLPPDHIARFHQWLAPDERERAERFHFEQDRRRFILRRGWLRLLLGSYLNMLPVALTYATHAHGKPLLAEHGIAFSLSHSDDLAVVAFARHPVGIDLERIRADVPYLSVAQGFTRREQAFIAATSPEDQASTFYACWTCKEACVKALGVGLAMSLQDFDVTAALTSHPINLTLRTESLPPQELHLMPLDRLTGYALAVAVAAPCDGIEFFDAENIL